MREIASLIRDTERHGKARIIDTNEGEEPEEMLKVERIRTVVKFGYVLLSLGYHRQIEMHTG